MWIAYGHGRIGGAYHAVDHVDGTCAVVHVDAEANGLTHDEHKVTAVTEGGDLPTVCSRGTLTPRVG